MFLKQSLFSISTLAGLTMAASAADFPVKAPQIAEPREMVSGYVELYGGWARTRDRTTNCFDGDCGTGTNSVHGWVLGGAGRGTWWWAPNYSVQLDAQAEGTSYKFTGGGDFFNRASAHSYLVGGHVNWRDPGRGLFGLFGAAGDSTIAGLGIRHGLIGAEGQLYWGPLTFYGQAGYNSTLGALHPGLDAIHAWFVRATARYYVTPNFRLESTVLYADGKFDWAGFAASDTTDFDTLLWRFKAEHRFATVPFSIFAAYEGSRTSVNTTDPPFQTIHTRITDHRVTGGIRLYLNERTLMHNDRNGTTLDIIAPHNIPSFQFAEGGGPV